MEDENFRKRLKKFDDWYNGRIADSERKLAELKQQYDQRRKQIVKEQQASGN